MVWAGGLLIGAGLASILLPLSGDKKKDLALPVFLAFVAFVSVSVVPGFLGLWQSNPPVTSTFQGFIIALLAGGAIASFAVNRR